MALKGIVRKRSITEGFDEIYLEQTRIWNSRRVKGFATQTNYYVDRHQWNDIVKNKLIGKEVEFEETKGLFDMNNREVLIAKIIIPEITQTDVDAAIKTAWLDGYDQCMKNFQVFPLQTRVYLQHEVDIIAELSYAQGTSNREIGVGFMKWYNIFKNYYNEKGYAFFKKVLGYV